LPDKLFPSSFFPFTNQLRKCRQSCFYGFPARQRVQQLQLPLFFQIARQDELASLAQFAHPLCVSRAKLLFESLANLLAQRWTLSRCRNRDLQIAAPDD